MIHAAHASRYHWGKIGAPVNFARGEWQISRVYSILKRFEAALYHAQRCLEICKGNKIGDFDLAYAYEALARAGKRKYLKLAREAGKKIRAKEDRDLFFRDLGDISY